MLSLCYQAAPGPRSESVESDEIGGAAGQRFAHPRGSRQEFSWAAGRRGGLLLGAIGWVLVWWGGLISATLLLFAFSPLLFDNKPFGAGALPSL